MSDNVYHRFSVNDKFETKVYTTPSVVVESGSTGWSGNMDGPSGSLSLYGGVRSRSDVSSGSAASSGLEVYPLDEVDTHSIDKIIQISGSYPAIGSIQLAYCTNTEPTYVSDITETRWYQEHYRPIALLFDWYHNRIRASYVSTSSLPSNLWVVHIPSMMYGRQIATGSVLIRDTTTASGSTTYVDDGYGNLVISGTHAGTTVSRTVTNLMRYSEDIGSWANASAGKVLDVTTAPNGTVTADLVTDDSSIGIHGIYENLAVNPTSGTKYTFSAFVKMSGSSSRIYMMAADPAFTPTNGIARFDLVSGTFAIEQGFDAAGMVDYGSGWYRIWATDTAVASGVGKMYLELANATGSRIFTGTGGSSSMYVWGMQCEVGTTMSMYVPTTSTSSSATVIDSGQVGNVFYNEGLIVFTNDPYYAPGQGPYHRNGDPRLHVQFSGSHIINSKIFMCRLHENECNCSRNPTWSSDVSGTLVRKGDDNTTYVTAVGIYNEDYELVAVAKLAQPIRKREKDRIDIRLRMDF